MAEYPGFCGPSYVAQSPSALSERTMNFYLDKMEVEGGQTQLALYPTPGVELLGTSNLSPGRAHFEHKGREFAVIGNVCYEVFADGSLTSRGTVAVDQYPATICTNGDGGGQLFITSGNNGYIFDLDTAAFTQVRTGGTRMGAHLNGYFLALDADTSTVYLSGLLDGLSWDPTDLMQRSIAPDPWISMAVWDRNLWLFGTKTSEIWYDAGTSPIPFIPHPSGLVAYGCAAPFSVMVAGGALHWLAATEAGSGQVVRASGFTPDVVSTFALSSAIAGYPDLAQAIAGTYEDLGHTFYILTFPASATWALDVSEGSGLEPAQRWAERGTWISEANTWVPWRPMYYAFAFGQRRALDRDTGAVYRLTSTVLVDVDSRPLRRVRRPPAVWAREQRMFVSGFELVLEPGLGAVTGDGTDPQVALRISTDSGKTFGSERLRSAGPLGEYRTIVRWERCGSVRQGLGWQPELVMSDPIPWKVLGARLKAA